MWGVITYFFAVCLGLGFIIDIFTKEWKADFFEKLIMRFGAGICIFTFIGVVLNLIKVPLQWWIFLILAVVVSAAALFLRKKEILADFEVKGVGKNEIYTILLIVLFAVTAYMYINGSFSYPWFEDADPYGYGLSIKYIADTGSFSTPYRFGQYIEPYTQGFQILFAMLYQISDDLYWTMKYFNALIISFSIFFFYYFVKRFSRNKDIALFAAFSLFAVPAWVSHFVFSLNFNMALIPVLLYSLAMMRENAKWKYIAALTFASLLINHAYTSITVGIFFFIYFLNKVFVEEKVDKDLIVAGVGGFLLSMIYFIPAYTKHSYLLGVAKHLGGIGQLFIALYTQTFATIIIIGVLVLLIAGLYFFGDKVIQPFKGILTKKNMKFFIFVGAIIVLVLLMVIPQDKMVNQPGSSSRDYTLKDFFVAQKGNMINNPIGIGMVLMTLFCIGIIVMLLNYSKIFSNLWLSTSFIWAVFALIITLGFSTAIVYVPFRMWTFFAMFGSIIVGYSISVIAKMFKGNLKWILIIVIAALIIPTSFSQKYTHNTVGWPEHMVLVPESQQLYVWMREGGIPKDSKVYTLCNNPVLVYGYNMDGLRQREERLSSEWRDYFYDSLNKSVEDNYEFLSRNGFEYVALGVSCIAAQKKDQNDVQMRIQEMINSTHFLPVKNTNTEFLFKVV